MKKIMKPESRLLSDDEFSCSLTELRTKIDTWLAEVGPTGRVSIEQHWDDVTCTLRWEREESEAEFEKRKEATKKRAVAARKATITRKLDQEAGERALYEALKKKFESA